MAKAENATQKSDIIRLGVIMKHGGVYADTDIESFKSVDELLGGSYGFCVREEKRSGITSTIFGGMPRHPFFARAERMLYQYPQLNTRWASSETGSKFVRDVLVAQDSDKFRIPSSAAFYPVSFRKRARISELGCYETSCSQHFPHSYGMHLFGQHDNGAARAQEDADRLQALLLAVEAHNQVAKAKTMRRAKNKRSLFY